MKQAPGVQLIRRRHSCEVIMESSGEVTLERGGRRYGATFTVENGMLKVKTHTEVRSLEIGDQAPEALARRVLSEIVEAQTRTSP